MATNQAAREYMDQHVVVHIDESYAFGTWIQHAEKLCNLIIDGWVTINFERHVWWSN